MPSIILFPACSLKHFSFCKSSRIGNAQIPEESLGERREGCSWWEVVRKERGQGEEGSGHGRTVRRGAEHKSSREPALLGAVNQDICKCEGLRGWKRASSIPALCIPHLTTVLSTPVATSSWSHLLLCSLWACISARYKPTAAGGSWEV